MTTTTEITPTTPPKAREPIYEIEPAVLSECESIAAEMVGITYRLNLLRLATREEVEAAMKTTRGKSATKFLLTLLAETRELKVADIEEAIAARKWTSSLNIIRGNANIAIAKTGLGLRVKNRRHGAIWRLESKKVQDESALSADKRESALDSLTKRHEKVLEIAAKTDDKKTKCLLQLVAQQTTGIRLAEIVKVFDETLTGEELIKFIGTTNSGTLASIDTAIHIRNGIAIIGPQNPHWESEIGEPILVDSMDSIYQLAARNRQGTSAKIKATPLNQETPEQTIARLKEENLRLQAAVDKAEKDVEEALRLAQEATEAKDAANGKVEELTTRLSTAKAASSPEAFAVKIAEAVTAQEAHAKDLSGKLQETLRRLANTKSLLDRATRDAESAEAARIEGKKATEKKTAVLEGGQSEEIARLERLLRNTIDRARDAETRSSDLLARVTELKANQADPQTLATLRQQAGEAASLRTQMETAKAHVQELEARLKKFSPAETETLKARITELEARLANIEVPPTTTTATPLQTPPATSQQQPHTPSATEIAAMETLIEKLQGENAELQELLESATGPADTTSAQAPIPASATETATTTTATPLQTPPATSQQQPHAPSTTNSPSTPLQTLEQPKPQKPKPQESPSPIKDLEDAKTFKTTEALYDAVEKAVTFGLTLNPRGMPKGPNKRIKNAVKNLRGLPPLVEAAKTRLLGLLENMKGQGDVIPSTEITKFLESTIG